ncbi:MAG: hypothetical protein H6Q72_354 [Firmicutes bacterium]|nr:hypothetical protein [Bacillota bacterium]
MLNINLERPPVNAPAILSTQQIQNKITVSGQSSQAEQNDLATQVGPAYQLELSATNEWTEPEIKRLKETGQIECQTCAERKYQDGSDDPSVSFKSPGHISPENSAAAVRAHEQEHVVNEQADARNEGRKVVSQSVSIFTSVCPECGKTYVSGGETRTTTATMSKSLPETELGTQVDTRI